MSNATSLQQYAYDYLKNIIISGQLDENKLYSERQLSQELNISRAPIRDALQRLSQEEYVDVLPKRGFRIHSLTKKDIISMHQMRTAIESFCLHQYASYPDSQQTLQTLEKLKENVSAQEQYLKSSDDISSYVDLDCRFHELVVAGIENAWFTEAFQKYVRQLHTMTKMTLTESERIRRSVSEHVDICHIIETGDTARINDWLQQHISSPTRISLGLIR